MRSERRCRSWKAFPEVAGRALWELRERGWSLAILSNTDPELLDASIQTIGVPVDAVVTAREAGSYKPAHGHWHRLFERPDVDRDRHVHVAASLFHDVAPCLELAVPVVWMNREEEEPDPPPTAELRDLSGLRGHARPPRFPRVSLAPPEPFVASAATTADSGEVAELIRTVERAQDGEVETTADDVRDEWSSADLERDVVLVRDGTRLVGYGLALAFIPRSAGRRVSCIPRRGDGGSAAFSFGRSRPAAASSRRTGRSSRPT